MNLTTSRGLLADRARQVAEIAARHVHDVDARARFPREAVDALRSNGLLAAAVPSALGGENATLHDLSEVARILAESCSATGMIFVMHQIQVLCLTRHTHGSTTVIRTLRRLVMDGTLMASATTEAGIGGSTRTSGCAIDEQPNGTIVLRKTAPVISYGAFADVILTTARASLESAPSDQVLVICPRATTRLTQLGEWDTLGFRGTCSPGFQLEATVDREHIVPDDFATISAETMLPVSHLLWATVWLGISDAAAAKAATAVQRSARKSIGTLPPAATRLAELLGKVAAFGGLVESSTRAFDDDADDRAALTSIPRAIAHNSLKITASDSVIDIVGQAMLVAGIAGYRQDSDLSLGRLLRDSYGTAVMVNNDRILANNAQLSLLQRRKARR
ncbi:acyl-CoA dehydrogenase [Frondihabitans sp. PhB188]|uniref:acyl-CoA dehydrogenase family protein n=1 Tax=Frondihabitans sp. PhB188 TaxID=2485200 RepID=UPI000F496E81|nr:acyl-CoA dehydrogenase family protein [Frondihabitans sp. PhB188]ROQ40128.1 acyl-CoA dehydrogenase [Frondihabitans sp. PhB188]